MVTRKPSTTHNSEQGHHKQPYLITFTDLIYAILIGYGISLLHSSVIEQRIPSLFLEIFVLVLLVYDWYGAHLVGTQTRAPTASAILDFTALLIYFGLFISSALLSIYLFPFLAARAARGIVLNYLVLRTLPKRPEEIKLRVWNISSGAMFLAYLTFFILAFFSVITSTDTHLLMVAVIIWAISYILALLTETHLLRRDQQSQQ